ncbi:STAS domain-containing protein [Nocardia sp. NPDC004722]
MNQRDRRVLGCTGSPLRVSWDSLGDDVVVQVAGEIDLSTADEFDTALRAASEITEPGARLILDLEKVEFLGAAGLNVLLRARERCAVRGVGLVSVAGHERVTKPVRILGMSDLLGLVPRFPEDRA